MTFDSSIILTMLGASSCDTALANSTNARGVKPFGARSQACVCACVCAPCSLEVRAVCVSVCVCDCAMACVCVSASAQWRVSCIATCLGDRSYVYGHQVEAELHVVIEHRT